MYKYFLSAGLATAAAAFMIAPEKAPADKRENFSGLNWAHRGLHDISRGIPENSLSAFRAARDRGFGIELDLQLTADGQVVVFHDTSLLRMCGIDIRLDSLTYNELLTFRLGGTHERIPLFSQVLELLDGRVPLLVELKPCRRRRELCSAALELMRTYKGELCMESFDPFAVAWFRRNAPDILRGQLTMKPRRQERSSVGLNAAVGFALSHVITNCLSRPNFIAHRLEKKTFAVRMAERMGAMSFAWTSRQPGNESGHDGVIFEGYVPQPRY
ncbi:MAG: glycerophosphodiester phosphodiesterase family protein [Candidatus Heteroscillospira sp.]|jgi:glycerophosphoryl diester phosphodiesterase